MTGTTDLASERAAFVGGTPFFASQHDQRLFYALYVPKDHTPDAEPLPLVVIQHGTGRSAELYRDRWKEFAIEHRCVILTPLFPAGLMEPRELHSFKFLEYRGLRFDEELLHIVDEVAEGFNTRRDRFYLHGFSGGGQFAHRFFYAHPDRLAGVSIGAPGRITQLDPEPAVVAGHRRVRGAVRHPHRPRRAARGAGADGGRRRRRRDLGDQQPRRPELDGRRGEDRRHPHRTARNPA